LYAWESNLDSIQDFVGWGDGISVDERWDKWEWEMRSVEMGDE